MYVTQKLTVPVEHLFLFLLILCSTVWYELLCNEWPFRSQPCETVIWQVGRGMKQSLSTVNAPREVKVSFTPVQCG